MPAMVYPCFTPTWQHTIRMMTVHKLFIHLALKLKVIFASCIMNAPDELRVAELLYLGSFSCLNKSLKRMQFLSQFIF